MSRVTNTDARIVLALLLLVAVSCSGDDKPTSTKAMPSQAQPAVSMKLGPPEQEKLFSLPQDRTLVHAKVSKAGNAVALWVRRPSSVQLLITDHTPLDFKGHVGFQKGQSFHVIQPEGDHDRLIAGEGAEKDAWLVWGPGKGIEGEPLDNYFLFDSTGNHVIFALYDKGRWSWVLDNKSLGDYHRLVAPVLSDEAKTITWIDGSKGSQRVVVNGKLGPTYDEVYNSSLYVSPDGRHWFYMASRSNKLLAVWDGVEHPEYANLGRPVFSSNGDRVAYSATNDGKRHVVVLDGRPGAEYDGVAALTFSADGRRLAHRANGDGKAFFVVDGKVEEAKFDNLANEFLFASGGKRTAYAGVRGETWFIVVDGKEGEGCSGIFGMTFSQDGQHFAKGEISADGRLHVSVDGVRRWSHSGQPAMRPRFSPDGSRLLYGIRRNSRVMLVVDGVEGLEFETIGSAAFSADGKHLAFFARTDGGKDALYLDGQMQREFDSLPCGPTFTPGGQLVYCAVETDKWYIVIDGTVSKPYDRVYLPPSRVVPVDPDGNLAYVALEGNDVVRIRHRPVKR